MVEVVDLDSPDVIRRIEAIVLQVTNSILAQQGLTYTVPTRSGTNQQYIPELDRIVLRDKVSSREFGSTATVRYGAAAVRGWMRES